MPRAPRIWFPGAVYHIIQRGVDQQEIFRQEGDRRDFLNIAEEVKTKMPFKVYLYVLMDNHYHMTIETPETHISQIMHAINSVYAAEFNKRYGRKGHLFQSRFKGILVDKDNYLIELSRYIHLNPVKAGLVNDPKDYVWSSYGNYINKRDDFFVDTELILASFKSGSLDSNKRYEYFVNEKLNINNQEPDWLHKNTKRRRFLGSGNFINMVLEKGARHL